MQHSSTTASKPNTSGKGRGSELGVGSEQQPIIASQNQKNASTLKPNKSPCFVPKFTFGSLLVYKIMCSFGNLSTSITSFWSKVSLEPNFVYCVKNRGIGSSSALVRHITSHTPFPEDNLVSYLDPTRNEKGLVSFLIELCQQLLCMSFFRTVAS